MLAAASKIETKMPDTKKDKNSIINPGMISESTGVSVKLSCIISKLIATEKTDMQSLAINMKTSAKPPTNANFALCFKTRINEFNADEQKLSLEIAM